MKISNNITGRRLLIQILSWDFCDYLPRFNGKHGKNQNTTTKRCSKKSRRLLKQELFKDLEYEED